MTNAERILVALDKRLDHEVTLVIYGRASIALGFENPPDAVKQTLDVDGIIPVSQVEAFRADSNFWDAQEAANRELEKDGLSQLLITSGSNSAEDFGSPYLNAVEDADDVAHRASPKIQRQNVERRKKPGVRMTNEPEKGR